MAHMGNSPLTDPQYHYINNSRVCRMATVNGEGQPHAVPLCHVATRENLYIVNGHETTRLRRRTRNILKNRRTAVIFDHYSEDWESLGHVMVTGLAEILIDGTEHRKAARLLKAKFHQMQDWPLYEWGIIAVRMTNAVSWGKLPTRDILDEPDRTER